MSDLTRGTAGFPSRIGAVWFRHMRVYTRNLFSNALPPFIEPIIFLAGIGLGLGSAVGPMEGIPYIQFLALGLLMTAPCSRHPSR